MQEQLIIEHIFCEFAIGEINGQPAEVPLDLLPDDVRAGEVYHKGPTGWVLDPAEVERRKQVIAERYKQVFGEGK